MFRLFVEAYMFISRWLYDFNNTVNCITMDKQVAKKQKGVIKKQVLVKETRKLWKNIIATFWRYLIHRIRKLFFYQVFNYECSLTVIEMVNFNFCHFNSLVVHFRTFFIYGNQIFFSSLSLLLGYINFSKV